MNPIWALVGIWMLATNLYAFVLMGVDRSRSASSGRRVQESTFYKLCIAGGAFGVVGASSFFHHNTYKDSFNDFVFVAVIVWVFVLYGLQFVAGAPLS